MKNGDKLSHKQLTMTRYFNNKHRIYINLQLPSLSSSPPFTFNLVCAYALLPIACRKQKTAKGISYPIPKNPIHAYELPKTMNPWLKKLPSIQEKKIKSMNMKNCKLSCLQGWWWWNSIMLIENYKETSRQNANADNRHVYPKCSKRGPERCMRNTTQLSLKLARAWKIRLLIW